MALPGLGDREWELLVCVLTGKDDRKLSCCCVGGLKLNLSFFTLCQIARINIFREEPVLMPSFALIALYFTHLGSQFQLQKRMKPSFLL